MGQDLPLKILAIVPYAPNRIRTRPFHLIRGLVGQGNEVTLATMWTGPRERQDIETLRPELAGIIAERMPVRRSVWNCIRAIPGRRPVQACYSWNPRLASRIAQAAGTASFDVVHVEHLRGVRYGLLLDQIAVRPGSRRSALIWDSVDCITALFRQAMRASYAFRSRLTARLELARTERYEGWAAGQFDRVLVTSITDGRELANAALKMNGHSGARMDELAGRIVVLPNGVDLQYFSPVDGPREPATLVFSGKMSYHANVAAAVHLAREVMPRIWRVCPGARLRIVGKDPPGVVRRLGTPVSAGEKRIHITGTVEDIRPFLRTATLAVAPIRYGAGIQNKVLEALACGTPVVASPQAVAALRVRSGADLMVADGAQEFAEAVLSLLENPVRRLQLGCAGRRFVEQNHDWAPICRLLTEAYRDAIS